jgi:hypothetical protein
MVPHHSRGTSVTTFVCFLSTCVALVLCDCRIVAIGDLHGDLENAQRVLRTAKILDANNRWAAGCSTLVQTGDIVDRGPQSLGTLDFFRDLRMEATVHGGEVIMLIGNHELLNFEGATHYVNAEEKIRVGGDDKWRALFAAGGKYRKWMSELDIIAMVNQTVFVHAGVLPSFAGMGVAGLNRMFRVQLKRARFGSGVLGDDGPLWTRAIITKGMAGECSALEMSLNLLGAKRMVIGHTIQSDLKVHTYCGGRLVAIDVAISRAISGQHPGCVELVDDMHVRPIYAV